jgi:hypothetical protein
VKTTRARHLQVNKTATGEPFDAAAVRWLPGVLGAVVLVLALGLSLRHLNDRFQINHTSGVWLALADAFRHGTLYLPKHVGAYYGGGRYMPLGIVLDGGTAKVTGNVLVASKLVSLVAMAALVALVVRVCRWLGADWPLAIGLAAVPVATGMGLEQVAGVRNDALAVLLQLGAVVLVWRVQGARGAVAGGALAGLALVAKTSAMWGLVIVVWWCWRRRGGRGALDALLAGILAAGVALAGIDAASHGRLAQSVFGGNSFWPPHITGLLVGLGQNQLEMILAVLPLLGVAVFALLRRGALTGTPFQTSLIAAALVTVVLFFDSGVAANHLIDVSVLVCVVLAGTAAASVVEWTALARVVTVVGLAIGLAGVYSLPVLRPDSSLGWHQFAQDARPGERILSEDSSVPVSLGQRPQVLDSFALRVLADHHPSEVQPLVDEIDAKSFGAIFLVSRPESDTTDWYRVIELGPRVRAAILRNYHFDHVRGGLNVYVPDR